MKHFFRTGLTAFCLAALLSACGNNAGWEEVEIAEQSVEDRRQTEAPQPDGEGRQTEEQGQPSAKDGQQPGEQPSADSVEGANAAETEALRERFGDACISEQTFEVELSEYDGKVWFVPYSSGGDGSDFHMQIVRGGESPQDMEILRDIQGENLGEYFSKDFESLDAVSFYDVNYDGETDILLLGKCGGREIASVYYGYGPLYYGYDPADYDSAYFSYQETLSQNISEKAPELTVSGIRAFLSEGKRNGEFSGYQEAYRAAVRLYEMEGREDMGYDLIYVDEDDVPELLAGVRGYWVSLYAFRDGKLYQPMAEWGYGAMGNAGYEYSPYQNSLRNYNADYAGAIRYTTYMTLGPSCSIDTVGEIKVYAFDDVNGNGMPDEAEEGSLGKYSVTYFDGVEVPGDAEDPYDVGGYEYMDPSLDQDTILSRLEG